MAENKTQPTENNVQDFLLTVENEQRREDALELVSIFGQETHQSPVLWGTGMVGFGTYAYHTADKKQHHFMRTGFSPRKQNLALYIMVGLNEFEEKMQALGKYKTGKSCLYIKKLSDVNQQVLRQIIRLAYEEMARRYPI